MSEQPGAVVKVARDLREIENLYQALLVQAIHHARARIDGTSLPGGEAMVALGPVGSPEQWQEWVTSDEYHHFAACPKLDHTRCHFAERVDDEDGIEPPLQTLLFWSEQWRVEHGYPLEKRPTITSEVRFLRWALEWAWRELPEWADFEDDVETARKRIENLLMAGERAERGAPCLYETCKGARLVRKLVPTRGPEGAKVWEFSDWHCPKCKRSWDDKRYAAMVTAGTWRAQYEEIDGKTWCSVRYAARQADIPESTIRAWVTQTKKQERPIDVNHPIATACLPAGRRVGFVCLEDVLARRDRPRGRKDVA